MLTKIYLAVLAVSIFIMGFFVWYAWSWLQSIGLPTAAIEGFEYHASLAKVSLAITTIVLMLLSAAVLWTNKNAWALWTTWVYSAAFTVIIFFWLQGQYWDFWKKSGFADPGYIAGPITAAFVIMAVTGITAFLHFGLTKIRPKFQPEPSETEPEATSEESPE